jgi:hypothetical protein
VIESPLKAVVFQGLIGDQEFRHPRDPQPVVPGLGLEIVDIQATMLEGATTIGCGRIRTRSFHASLNP